MGKAHIPMEDRRNHLKWLRFYLDFCENYDHPPEDPGSTAAFMQKLKEKHQSPNRRRQATKSVRVYRDIIKRKNSDRDLVSDRISIDFQVAQGGLVASNNSSTVNPRIKQRCSHDYDLYKYGKKPHDQGTTESTGYGPEPIRITTL